MKASYHPGVHRFAVFTVCWTALLLIAGALVTSNDAALAVPDWPKSFGTWTPHMVGGVFYEHSHRVIAGVLGVLTLILATLIWIKEERRWLRWFAVVAVGGIVAQAILGGQVVIRLLHYWLPVMHACFAQIMFGAILSIAVFTSKWWTAEQALLEDRGSPSIYSLVLLNAGVIFLQVFLGAGFRHKEIPIWPHAAGSLAVLATVIWTAVVLRKRFENSPELTKMRILLHSVFGLQFLLGIGAYWSRIATAEAPQPMPLMVTLTVTHTVVGALLFAVSILTILLCYRLVPRQREVAVSSQGRVTV
ncbi:MAG TPA: COX15/CtaA family protein [Candidatus Binatus sp.]|jgi:cytochrome c oxidase assembly protein subunit 15|nr:COX15/CtaA family protein [Candidatus Binatus sp.]